MVPGVQAGLPREEAPVLPKAKSWIVAWRRLWPVWVMTGEQKWQTKRNHGVPDKQNSICEGTEA